MRTFLYLFIFLIFCNACNNNDYAIEDKLIACIYDQYDAYGIDLKQKIIDFENELILQKIISDNSGESYYNLFKRIEKEENLKFLPEFNVFDSLSAKTLDKSKLDNSDCLNSMNEVFSSGELKDSKIIKIQIEISKMYKGIQETGDVITLPQQFAKCFTNAIEPRDIEHNFYKTFTIITLMMNVEMFRSLDEGLTRKLPPPTVEKDININRRNVLIVLVKSKDELFVNDKLTEINKLRQIAKNFLSNPNGDKDLPEKEEIELVPYGKFTKSKGIISLQNDRGTSYDMYIQVQNELAAAVRELREELSQKVFKTKYNDLDKEKRKVINKVIPMAISEAEPKDIGVE